MNLHQNQDKGPVFGFGVPHDRFHAENRQDRLVDETGVDTEESVDQVGDDDGREQMGEQDHALVEFFEPAGQLREDDCDRNREDGVDDNECDVVKDGVPGDDPGVAGLEEVLEVGQAAPGASVDALAGVVGLKCDDQPRHRHVVVDDEVGEPRDHHHIQGDVLFDLFKGHFFVCHTGTSFEDWWRVSFCLPGKPPDD